MLSLFPSSKSQCKGPLFREASLLTLSKHHGPHQSPKIILHLAPFKIISSKPLLILNGAVYLILDLFMSASTHLTLSGARPYPKHPAPIRHPVGIYRMNERGRKDCTEGYQITHFLRAPLCRHSSLLRQPCAEGIIMCSFHRRQN